jgi:hypothetical protein
MRRLGATLIAAGAVVWTAGAAAWISGVWVTLPPDTVRALALTLAAVAGGSLVGAGALIGRSRRTRVDAQLATPHVGREPQPQLTVSDLSSPHSTPDRARLDERVT